MSTPAADIRKTQTPAKKRDRQRPFLLLNARPVDKAPDGDGVACGCVPPSVFGTDFEALARELIDQKAPALKWLRLAIQIARAIAEFGLRALLAETIVGPFLLDVGEIFEVIEKRIVATMVKIVLPRAARTLPQWVPVAKPPAGATPAQKRARNQVITQDQIVEVSGIVERSYQNPIEVPFAQWHRWLDWNFNIKPDPEFASVLGPVNKGEEKIPDKMEGQPIVEDGVIECQFDAGALFADHARYDNGNDQGKDNLLFFAKERAGPMMEPDNSKSRSWAWPMKGQFVWASGRWVYDCCRASKDDPSSRMATMLNPCKAIATAKMVGHKFKENPLPVPATQFMFFISKRGGYLNFDSITDRDYEFIVDLPENDFEQTEPFEIGRTNKIPPFSFDHNTIVIRPRLLKHLNTGVFLNSTQPAGQVDAKNGPHMEPEIEILKPEKPGTMPTHVKVKVKTSQLDPKMEAYGFILTLGWFDPAGVQAAKVRECTVTLLELTSHATVALEDPHRRDTGEVLTRLLDEAKPEAIKDIAKVIQKQIPFLPDVLAEAAAEVVWAALIDGVLKAIADSIGSDEEWVFRVGVNGLWRSLFIEAYDPKKGRPFPSGVAFKFLHLPTEPLVISMNGLEMDQVGEIMGKPRGERLLHEEGIMPTPRTEIPWDVLTLPGESDAQIQANRKKLVLEYIARIIEARLDDNDPLGFADKKHFPVKEGTGQKFFELTFVPEASKEQKVLFETDLKDYALHYTVDYSKIDPKNFEPKS